MCRNGPVTYLCFKLLYTTFITSTCVVVAILVAISVNFRTCLSLTVWITINCESECIPYFSRSGVHMPLGAFISILLVHSLGRVVHRREREAWIQLSASRSGMTRMPARSSRHPSRRTTLRSQSATSGRNKSTRERYHGDPNDPYSETRPLDQERFSWQFGNIAPVPTTSMNSTQSPLILSVRNVTQDSKSTQEYEFEPASSRKRKVSWQSNIFSSGGEFYKLLF